MVGLLRRVPDRKHIDLILDEFFSLGLRNAIGRCAVLEIQIYLPPQQATLCIDVIDYHFGHVCISDTQKRKRPRYIGDYPYLNWKRVFPRLDSGELYKQLES